MNRIPVHSPDLGAREQQFALEALKVGDISGSGGQFLGEFEEKFAAFCEVEYAVAVSSGTTALDLAAEVAGIGFGDEVLVSASTNIATALCVARRLATVVPVDVERDTWCMDPALLEGLLTQRTRAVIPVHLLGHPCAMREINDFARRHGLVVIEDAAEAHGAVCEAAPVGGLGDMGCFSFYANKVITTGEGGMLTTHRADFAQRARSLRNLAFGEPRFMHRELGFNYRMTNVQAAIGCAQMERISEIIAAKRALAAGYLERLADVPGLRLPVEREWAQNVYWMFGVVVELDYPLTRDELMFALAERGIDSRTMFCPMGRQPALLKRELVSDAPCPVADELWERGLYLPSDHRLTSGQLDAICDAIRSPVVA